MKKIKEALSLRDLFALVLGDLQFRSFSIIGLEIVQQTHLIGFYMSKQGVDLQVAGDTNKQC